jgi:putative FmdB family regulatory protein
MPLYEYECEACEQRFEVIQKFSDPHVDACRKCGKGPVRRLMSSPAIQFKGSGWYITDYAKKSGSDSSPGPAGKSDKAEAKSDRADTKSDTPAKSETAAKTDASSSPSSTTKE